MNCRLTRRQLLTGAAAIAAGRPFAARAAAAPAAPVSIAKCASYDPAELVPALDRMFDRMGGLARIVKGKTVAIKVNMTGDTNYRLGFLPAELVHWTHPRFVGAVVHLMGRAGASRVRILECAWSTADPLEEVMYQANWDPGIILNAAPRVEFENTNYLGRAKKYSRFMVPGGGYIFKGYDFNHSFEDCDVFVSIPKLKEHATAGITLSMKNCFGSVPCTIYGDGAQGKSEPTELPSGGRTVFHRGHFVPPGWAENDPKSPRQDGWRVPRIVAEIVAARPIDLAVIDGISSMAGGEGPWIRGSEPVKPNVIIAGTNCVNTDAVATAVMGYDPMAERGTRPFLRCDSTLRLAEELGVGTRDLSRIEVVGTPIKDVVYDFGSLWKTRRGGRG